MRGRDEMQESLFTMSKLEGLVPADHTFGKFCLANHADEFPGIAFFARPIKHDARVAFAIVIIVMAIRASRIWPSRTVKEKLARN